MSTITPKRIMAKRATSKRTMPNRSFSQSEIDRIDKLFAKPKMPKLPTITPRRKPMPTKRLQHNVGVRGAR